MTFIDIDQEVQFVYMDPESKNWKHKTGTIKELLQIYTAYQFIFTYDINAVRLGDLENGKKEKSDKLNIFA